MSGSPTDALLTRYQTEVDERQQFIDNIVGGAEGRDLSSEEMELVTRASDRMAMLNGQIERLSETARIAADSRTRSTQVASQIALARNPQLEPGAVKYRSAGHYLTDQWRAAIGEQDARERLELFHRAAAHQTTADNLGVIPEPLVGPIVNFVDRARPLVTAFGPRDIPNGPTFNRMKVTQQAQVGKQTAEKTELASRKLLLGRNPVTVDTFGGYVNVSRQDMDWSQPQIMDQVVESLQGEYAVETEEEFAADLVAAATVGGTAITGAMTQQQIAAVLWGAAASVYTATKGQGGLILAVSPDMLGVVGPVFNPVNPQNAQSTGFGAGNFGQGVMGNVSAISVIMSGALPATTAIVASTAAAEVYEQRGGVLQVVEPSVLGTQVAYYGYFGSWIAQATGIISLEVGP